jgi:hypothetical protein
MDWSRITTDIALLSLIPIGVMFAISAFASPLGSLSLPCVTMMTSFIYFYFMPAAVLVRGDDGFFGMFIGDLTWVHTATLLYTLGAIAAFAWHWRTLNANPALPYAWDRKLNRPVYLALWIIAIMGVFVQFAQGWLNITGSESYRVAEDFGHLAFLTQSSNLLIPLTIVLLIRERFGWRSLLMLTAVLFALLQAGFRFRVLILAASAVTAYTLQRGIKLGMLTGFLGVSTGIPLFVVLGSIRRYGLGIDLTALNAETVDAASRDFAGEFGVVYAFDYISAHPLPPLSHFEPWLVGIARLVPSALWPDKPQAHYLQHIAAGATDPNAQMAGIAAPQHAEILLQMGWWGLLPLAFLYFSAAGWLVKRFAYRGQDVRLAGCALIPFFFGYYMQSRGYFFQILSDGLFMLAPLFLLNIGMKRGSAFARARQPHYAAMEPRW